jgi:hypothetical protein
VTVRVQAVVVGPSAGGQGPNNAAELVSDPTARDARDSDANESIPYDVEKISEQREYNGRGGGLIG